MPVHPPRSPDSARRRAPARSRVALSRSLYVAVVVGALLTLSAWALASARPASQGAKAGGNTALADDDAEGALFQLAGLTPGQAESRCITVSNDGAVPDGIRLIGGAGGSGLDEYLHLTVDTGSGGRFGDCGGFTGAPVFDGSLGEFVRRHHDYDSGLVASTPAQSGSTTFRLRMALDDVAAAQGGTATASFAWEARSADIIVEPPPPAPDPGEDSPPTDPQTPAPEAEGRPAAATPAGGSPEPEADRPAPGTPQTGDPQAGEPQPDAATPAAPATPQTGGPTLPELGSTLTDDARPRPRPEASRPRRRPEKPAASTTAPQTPGAARRPVPAADDDRGLLETIAQAIAQAIVPVVQRTAFPLILLILGGLFLLIQNRIDSRDPKLARAPLHAQPDLPFLPPPSPGDVRS